MIDKNPKGIKISDGEAVIQNTTSCHTPLTAVIDNRPITFGALSICHSLLHCFSSHADIEG